jgi:hypothetical protein
MAVKIRLHYYPASNLMINKRAKYWLEIRDLSGYIFYFAKESGYFQGWCSMVIQLI